MIIANRVQIDFIVPHIATIFVLLFFTVSFFAGFGKSRVDYGESEIHKEEGANEYHAEEVGANIDRIGLLIEGLDVGPSFQRRALEHHQQRIINIVEVGHPVVRILIDLATEVAFRALLHPTTQNDRVLGKVLHVKCAFLFADAALFQLSFEELDARDGKNKEEEE